MKLDIFPSDIVSNLAVVKSPRPDLPGSFAGGLLLIETSSYPAEQVLKAGVSVGGNSLSTFRQMPSYEGGKLDWIGFDDGSRAYPASLGPQRLARGRVGDRYLTEDQISQVGRGFSNVWNPSSKLALPQLGAKLTAAIQARSVARACALGTSSASSTTIKKRFSPATTNVTRTTRTAPRRRCSRTSTIRRAIRGFSGERSAAAFSSSIPTTS